MTRAQFRPCIDLHDGQVKQIVGSTLRDDSREVTTNFVAAQPPGWFAELYRRDHLTGGHVIQLGQGNAAAAREALTAWPGGLQIGGGISHANAADWLAAGAARVIVTSAVFSGGKINREELDALFRAVGRDRLVLDLSCRRRDGKYFVVTDRWQTFTDCEVNRATLSWLADYGAEFLVHAVDVEGKQSGIDTELLTLLATNSPLDCVYAGGITTLADIEQIETVGRGRIHYTVGSALDIFGGKLAYAEVVRHART